jgi:lipid-A-disaccharide synthase-like uncharacterized protein
MVALFVIGSSIGGIWDESDTAGAITVALWAISIIGAMLLLIAFAVASIQRRAGSA